MVNGIPIAIVPLGLLADPADDWARAHDNAEAAAALSFPHP